MSVWGASAHQKVQKEEMRKAENELVHIMSYPNIHCMPKVASMMTPYTIGNYIMRNKLAARVRLATMTMANGAERPCVSILDETKMILDIIQSRNHKVIAAAKI